MFQPRFPTRLTSPSTSRPHTPSLLLALLGLSALGLCTLSHAANANTLTVPGQYPTIQAAITASAGGDTVLISDGTYTGPGDVDLDFGGKNLTVTSQNGAATTIINCGGYFTYDGTGDHRGFILQNGETNAVIRGLTIQNGYESGNNGISDPSGGGIEVLGATVTLQNCILTGNTAPYGGGLLNGDEYGGTVTLTDCALTANSAGEGGGLYSAGPSILTNCTFTRNRGDAGEGGGLHNAGGAATLTNDVFYGDAGGEVSLYGGTASAAHCDIGGALGGVTDGGGNIDADPQFVSAPADLHLQAGSLCLGVGTPDGAPTTTLDGYPRPDPPSIGAYERARAATTTALTSSLNPSPSGQPVTFTATVTGGSPAGGVTFTLDGAAQAPITVDGNGRATLTTSALTAGPHSVTAAYGGDAGTTASTSGTLTQTVSASTAATTLATRSVSGSPGQTVNLYAQLTTTGGAVLPGQTVTFSIDGAAVASGVTNGGGVRVTAYTLPAALTTGSHTLTAAFSGDANNAPSSGTATLTVVLPALKLTASGGTGTPGQAVTLRAGLHRAVGGAAVAGEAVTFSVDGNPAGTATTNGAGQAALPYAIPAGEAAGGHPITVAFAGDGSYAAASGTNTLTVKSAAALSVANVSGPRGTSVTLTAVLTAGGAASPGKTVSFKVDGAVVGTAVTDSTGTASLSYPIPAGSRPGQHKLSVFFAGDAANASAGGTGTLTVS